MRTVRLSANTARKEEMEDLRRLPPLFKKKKKKLCFLLSSRLYIALLKIQVMINSVD